MTKRLMETTFTAFLNSVIAMTLGRTNMRCGIQRQHRIGCLPAYGFTQRREDEIALGLAAAE